jgi:uncharacterized damage-inducible protein DinB
LSVARERLVAGRLPGYAPELGAALWRLQDARDRTLRLLAELQPDFVDRDVSGNTIGTILYHVALIEADWLFSDILQADLPPDLAARFPADHRDERGILTAVRGESVDDHRSRLAAVRAELLERLRGMDDEELHRPRTLPSYDASPAWVLHHLAQHEAEHRAEIGAVLAVRGD